MAENQNHVPNLSEIINEIMNEYAHEEEEVHLEPQPKTVANADSEGQPEEEVETTEEERTTKR